jgi:putative membrane protein
VPNSLLIYQNYLAVRAERDTVDRSVLRVNLSYLQRYFFERKFVVETIAKILIAVVALEHLYILYLEMFLWTKPAGLKAFGTTPETAASSKTLAANQGLYNGFLAAGLIWSVIYSNWEIGQQIALFFLGCVIVAAVYGGITVSRRILIVQGLPAAIAFVMVLLA